MKALHARDGIDARTAFDTAKNYFGANNVSLFVTELRIVSKYPIPMGDIDYFFNNMGVEIKGWS